MAVRRLVPLLFVLCAASCSVRDKLAYKELDINHYLADERDLEPVRMIMVLPFDGEIAPKEVREHVTRTFVREIAEKGQFIVKPLPRLSDEENLILSSESKGRIDTKELVDLCKRFHLDGVIIGRITSYQDYYPPRIGLRSLMVSVHSGDIVWAADMVFNAAKQLTRQDAIRYYEGTLITEASNHGREMIFLSPREFSEYAVARLLSTLQDR